MEFSSEYMERLYRVFPWIDDPFTREGRIRYEKELHIMERIIDHEWIREVVDRSGGSVDIVDICGGSGIGGVAFAKVLRDKYGVETNLTVVDLRRDMLRKAEEFSKKELGYQARTVTWDILEKLELGRKYDFALMWGHSTPHFSPWDLVRVYANVSRLLKPYGLFIYDETDRVYTVFYLMGYGDVLPEYVEENRIVLTIHKGRDYRTGYFHRVAYDLTGREGVEMKVYMWDIAGSATLAWIFFNDIDYIPVSRPYSGAVLAYRPRKTIEPEEYLMNKPRILSNT